MFFALAGCVEPFHLSIPANDVNALVIDGFVNATDSTMQVILSHAVSVTSTDSSYAEQGAIVWVQSDDGHLYSLTEGNAGYYSGKAHTSPAHKYQLLITTHDYKKYYSDFIDILEAPPIDSVYWAPSATGVALYVDSHQDNGGTRYYRWTFDETWKYRTPYYAYRIWQNGKLDSVAPANYICWKSDASTDIMVFSTAPLQQDRVSKFQVNFLPKGIQKLSMKYSINLHQRAISANLYSYWQQLKTNPQNLGSLFDVLPTQVLGNVHSDSDPSEIVLGYFSGSTVSSKRIFIDTLQLPEYLQHLPSYYNCPNDTVLIANLPSTPDGTWFYNTYTAFGGILGYFSTNRYCMDCRLSGGSTTPPPFWK